MNEILKSRWSRLGLALLFGTVFKFLLDVVFSLLYRNYPLLQPAEQYVYTILLTAGTLELMFLLRGRLRRKESWEGNPYRRYFLQWSLFMAAGIFFGFAVRWSFKLVFNSFYYAGVMDEFIILMLLMIAVTLMVTFELGVFLLNKWRFSLAELERFKKENAEFQFESLRAQVNPHFLFNSLNTLSSLIYEDRDKAESFIRELSDVYRYILENRGKELVTLEQELSVARSYIYLVQLRFEKNLTVDLDIPSSRNRNRIAPLTLQLLIENAVKHNIISRKKPLHVEVLIEGDHLVIKNNLQKKESREYSSQLGLKNIRSRYAFLTESPMEIRETEKEFIVKIPLIAAE